VPGGQTQITIHASGDQYKGDPQFQLFVDGHQVGGTYDVSASHHAGQWQDITVSGNFGAAGPHQVVVKFVNDAYGGTAATDRNLYIDSIDVNGHRFEGEAAADTAASGRAAADPHAGVMMTNGTLTFTTAGAPPVATNAAGYAVSTGGTGNDELVGGTARAALTGGGGKDAFILTAGAHDHVVTDFHVGEDVLDLRAVLKAAGYQGSDPIAAGVLSVTQSGADTLFSLDPDGAAGHGASHALVTLQHVTASALKIGVDYFWH
jgi:Ca2+-binding RTX toxin-like protein